MKKRILALLASQAATLVELAAEASQPAANDLILATVYAEANGNNPADLARKVNQDIAEALKVIKGKPSVTAKNGQQLSFPVYGQNQKVENWRMRSEILLESKDLAGISELLAKLQQMRLAVGSIVQQPAPATRRTAEDAATRQAIAAFQGRAKMIAEVFGKPYKIRQLQVQHNGSSAPVPMFRSAGKAEMADAAPMPFEAGESQVTTIVSGQIELSY